MPITIRLRRDTSDNWSRVNPKLALGEPGIEIDTQKMKVGNGTDLWNILPYMESGLTLEQIQDQTASSFFVAGSGISLDYQDAANTLTISTSGVSTISNSGDNRVLTSTGSGINAESNLTFDGTNLSAPYLLSTFASGNEGGEIQLAKPPSGTLSGGIIIDSYQVFTPQLG